VIESPFGSFDEARDKQLLFDSIRSTFSADELGASWIINIDGDEELAAWAGAELVRSVSAMAGSPIWALSLPIHYLWDDEKTRRIDGVYGSFRRVSAFRASTESNFVGSSWARGGLHCGNAPEALKGGAVRVEAPILHYGYMERADRVRKYRWYNEVDPENDREDRYRHMIAGDGPPRAGEEDIVFPGAEDRTLHAGPLRFRVVE
jgi:hypothetical protein